MSNAIDPARLRSAWSGERADTPGPAGGPPTEVDRRTSDAAAQALYDRFASGAARGHRPIACGDAPNGAPDPMPGGMLYVQLPGEPDPVGYHDIHQGTLGDCFLLAAAAGLANKPEGRALLRSAIVENRDEKGAVASYTVTLHRPETGWLGFRTRWVEQKVQVTPEYVQGHAVASRATGSPEVWPLVLEKAYIQLFGYRAASCGDQVKMAVAVLTGEEPQNSSVGGMFGYGPRDLVRDLAAGKTVVLSTRKELSFPPDPFPDHHAVLALGTVEKGGATLVKLFNPWGSEVTIPIDDLDKYFETADVFRVR